MTTPLESSPPTQGPASAAPAARSGAGQGRLGVVEVLDRDGHARAVHPFDDWPLHIGRAIDNHVVLDDPHVAAHHASIAPDADGRVQVTALPSLNGLQLGRRHLGAGERASPGPQTWTVGTTRLRLRLAADALEAERPLSRTPAQRSTWLFAGLLWLWLLAQHALALDPGASFGDWLSPLVSAPAAVGGWCLAWALASKLFLHRFDFMPHLALVVRMLLWIMLASVLLPLAAASTGWWWLSRIADSVQVMLVAALVTRQTLLVLPGQKRPIVAAALAAWFFGSATLLALNQQRSDRWFGELYVSTLPLPALLWAPVVPAERFVEEIQTLEKTVAATVRDAATASQADAEAEDE